MRPAAAQEPARLSAEAPITLRPTPRARAIARGVARTLGLRLPVTVSVGDDAPPEILEAVPAGHLGVEREDGRVHLVLAGPEGQVFRSEVVIGRESGPGAVRAVALAVEALRDAALDGPPAGTTRARTYTAASGDEVTWTYLERDGGLFGRPPAREFATPTFYVGFLGGLSTERLTVLVGPRIGLGLCLGVTCLVLEGDLPVLPDQSVACDGRVIEYRPVNLSLGVQLLPFRAGDFGFGFHFAILTRFGIANLVGVDSSRLATDFGLRAGLETSWRFAAPIELVLEIGADIHTSPAVFTRSTRPAPGIEALCEAAVERVLVEDIITTWAVLAVRVRP